MAGDVDKVNPHAVHGGGVILASSGLDPRTTCPVQYTGSAEAMCRVLDERLGRGFDVVCASDGWVLLRRGGERLAVTRSALPR